LCVWLSFGANPTARGNPFQEAATSDANFVAEPGALFTWILDSCIAIPIRITQKQKRGRREKKKNENLTAVVTKKTILERERGE
jgi:hypothetical protein